MITPKLADEQLHFLLYSLCDESYEVMTHFSRKIDLTCQKNDVLWCYELFYMLEMDCPKELRSCGWKSPKRYLDDGYFCLYRGSGNDVDTMWHIKCPLPEKVEVKPWTQS